MPLRLHRWFRFSLRTLLVLTTLVCVWLGLQVNQAARQRRAVQAIEELDAELVFAHDVEGSLSDAGEDGFLSEVPHWLDEPPAPAWLVRVLGPDYFRRAVYLRELPHGPDHLTQVLRAIAGLTTIERVDLHSAARRQDLQLLSTLRGLRVLDLNWGGIEVDALPDLAKLTRLEVLSLGEVDSDPRPFLARLTSLRRLDAGSYCDDNGEASDTLSYLGGLRLLEDLRLNGAYVTKPGRTALASLTRLRRLDLPGVEMDDWVAQPLVNLKELRDLDLSGANLTDGALEQLAKLPALRRLNLAGAEIGDEGIMHLSSSKALESLDLTRTKVTDAGLASLAGLAKLRVLTLAETQVQGSGLAALAACPLEELDLSECPLVAQQATSLGQFRSLRELSLGYREPVDFGDRELAIVAQLSKLEMLDLRAAKVTPQGLLLLTQLPKLERLGLTDSVAKGGTAELARMPLKHLKVRFTSKDEQINRQTDEALKRTLPGCQISTSNTHPMAMQPSL